MNFGKPLRLASDISSLRFYATNAADLAQFTLGSPPSIDEVLAAGA